MSSVSIEIVRNPDSTAGGEAIIRMHGVWMIPRNVTYRIDPIDDDSELQDLSGWPTGELQPDATRVTPDGIELLIGPDVVDAPALLPGTPVTVSVPLAFVSQELRWPNLPASRTQRIDTVVMSGEARAAEVAQIEAAERAARAREAEEQAARVREAEEAAAQEREAEELAARQRLEAAALELSRHAPATATVNGTSSVGSLTLDWPPGRDEHSATVDDLASLAANDPAPPPAAGLSPDTRDDAVREAADAVLPADQLNAAAVVPPSIADLEPSATPGPQSDSARPAAVLEPIATPVVMMAPASQLPVVAMDNRANDAADRNAGRPRTGWFKALAVGSMAAALLAGIALIAAPNLTSEAMRLGTGASGGMSISTEQIAAMLDVPKLSPLGVAADGVDLAEALRRADASLHDGGSEQDRLEAKYWLRKALALGLGDGRSTWAMTQLGTLYASAAPGATADFQSARTLWELAAGSSDSVATCFLAKMHADGVSVPKDSRRALEYYEKARARGGCRGLDEAVARLKKEAS